MASSSSSSSATTSSSSAASSSSSSAAASSSSSAAASSSSAAAASSSSAFSLNNEFTCIHCKSKSTTFLTGWPLGDGTVAQLCHRCGSLYEKGSFCETFHKNTEGWLECAICKKRLHCGCLVSRAEVHFTFFGKLCCNDCAKKMIRG